MLMVDDNMYKLARMQESLLKVENADKKKNLEAYINTVKQIDSKVYDELVKLIEEADKYNQSLETELVYLEKVKEAYDQMLELQMRFKHVCEQNGQKKLELSDISILNIEYIENRISAINGYLINLKNIENNKKKLESLNEQLVDEEKKRESVTKNILLFERKMKYDFVRISLKDTMHEKTEGFDIKHEYEKLGYDLEILIDSETLLDSKLESVDKQLSEIKEKYEIAKVCHSNLFNVDSKSVMNEIEKEYYTIKYRYVMLKMLKILSTETDNRGLAKRKREEFIELVESRNLCLDKLGITNVLNILLFVDVKKQLKDLNDLEDNVNNIHDIRKDISDITIKTEEMINQNKDYLITLSNTKKMIKSNVGMNDVDITTFDDIVTDEVNSQKVVLSNQVAKVKSIPSGFKLHIANQKAYGVIERVCKINRDIIYKDKDEVVTPELVIGPKESVNTENSITQENVVSEEVNSNQNNDEIEVLDVVDIFEPVVTQEFITPIVEEKVELDETLNIENEIKVEDVVLEIVDTPVEQVQETVVDNDLIQPEVANFDMFETTTPFAEPVLFSDKTEGDVPVFNSHVVHEEVKVTPEVVVDLPAIDKTEVSNVDSNDMPDAFWVTESVEGIKNSEEKGELSFEEQINALLSSGSNSDSVVRKR